VTISTAALLNQHWFDEHLDINDDDNDDSNNNDCVAA
jgi:hypothetical protein